MNKRNRLSKLFWLLPTITLCLLTLPSSAQRSSRDATLENVGKENPFEVVRPIAEAKKKLAARILKPAGGQPIIEVIPDMYMQMVMLEFLQASSLESVVSNLLSVYGKVSIDTATNSIIICDTLEKLKLIIAEIRKVDKTPQQVMIEVVIVDVKLEDDTEIGVDWAHPGGNGNIYTQSLAGVAAASGMDFTFLHNGIDISVKALQQVRDVEILASPRVMVLSGETALIQTVEEIPYTEASDISEGGQLTSTEFKEVGVTLEVSVLVTDEQRIKLTVAPEQSVNTERTGLSGQNDIPIIDTRRAMTTLLMDDGQVAVLGGLRRRNLKNSIDKIPLLGDLPLVGFLFSNDKIEVEHTELVVFISPHIYKGESLTEREMKQFNELRNSPTPEFQEHKRPEFEILKDVFGVINEVGNIYP